MHSGISINWKNTCVTSQEGLLINLEKVDTTKPSSEDTVAAQNLASSNDVTKTAQGHHTGKKYPSDSDRHRGGRAQNHKWRNSYRESHYHRDMCEKTSSSKSAESSKFSSTCGAADRNPRAAEKSNGSIDGRGNRFRNNDRWAESREYGRPVRDSARCEGPSVDSREVVAETDGRTKASDGGDKQAKETESSGTSQPPAEAGSAENSAVSRHSADGGPRGGHGARDAGEQSGVTSFASRERYRGNADYARDHRNRYDRRNKHETNHHRDGTNEVSQHCGSRAETSGKKSTDDDTGNVIAEQAASDRNACRGLKSLQTGDAVCRESAVCGTNEAFRGEMLQQQDGLGKIERGLGQHDDSKENKTVQTFSSDKNRDSGFRGGRRRSKPHRHPNSAPIHKTRETDERMVDCADKNIHLGNEGRSSTELPEENLKKSASVDQRRNGSISSGRGGATKYRSKFDNRHAEARFSRNEPAADNKSACRLSEGSDANGHPVLNVQQMTANATAADSSSASLSASDNGHSHPPGFLVSNRAPTAR